MEAARVLALRGHKVTLYEKENRLGGQLRYAYMPPGREEIQNIITYLEKQIAKLHVAVKTGNEVDLQTLEKKTLMRWWWLRAGVLSCSIYRE